MVASLLAKIFLNLGIFEYYHHVLAADLIMGLGGIFIIFWQIARTTVEKRHGL